MFGMLNTQETDCLLLCAGKDCFKKQRRAFDKLRDAATSVDLDVRTVPCQGSCVGPTAVVLRDCGPRWFEDLSGNKSRRDLVEFAIGAVSEPSKRLANRELTGKRRKTAQAKLARTADR